ncbi:MAG: class II fumarate hydratase [Bacteriovoracaceae bacterium]|nr:class II fumarate hydratase [Bacteriovoracaceae bacterium]
MSEFRIEKDSMGEVKVPKNAYYQAQTQRAVDNFPISGIRMKRNVIRAFGIIKKSAALANKELGLLNEDVVRLLVAASQEVIEGKLDDHFPIDIYQTGSGTSSNMNANEVIASRANEMVKEKKIDVKIHPNDHVNYGQSSNDVFPTALRIAAILTLNETFFPGLTALSKSLKSMGQKYAHVAKTGKTHLMDAMPVTFKQVFDGYAHQVDNGIARVKSSIERMSELPQGGTAVGTGINTHEKFGQTFARQVTIETGHTFKEAINHFEAQGTLDAPMELSSLLKTYATGLMKIANDFRWMNSGPNSAISEIKIAPIQPGSSIMPGKVNPVIEESVCMVCAQAIGNDVTVAIANQSGNFELNVMYPVACHNLLESIELLGNASKNFAERSVSVLTVNEKNVKDKLFKNPILVTALNPIIGYDKAATIAKKAYAEDRSLIDVALEETKLSRAELEKYLDPVKMTRGGFTT